VHAENEQAVQAIDICPVLDERECYFVKVLDFAALRGVNVALAMAAISGCVGTPSLAFSAKSGMAQASIRGFFCSLFPIFYPTD
jgi:hypothetical protein